MSRSGALRRLQGQELYVIGSVQCRVVVNGLCAFFFFPRGVLFSVYGGTATLPGAAVLCVCICVKCYGLFRLCNQWSEAQKSLPS